MDRKTDFKYCLQTTQEHPLAKQYKNCMRTINDFFKKEGLKKPAISDEPCLCLDDVEKEKAQKEKRNCRSTMDMAFGVSGSKKKQFQLAELKLDVNNPLKLKKTELDEKLRGSEGLVGREAFPIAYPHLIVVNKKIKEQARRRIQDRYARKKAFEVLDASDMKAFFRASD